MRREVPTSQVYYTDILGRNGRADDFINQNDPIPDDNYYDYMMFYYNLGLPNYHFCLSPDEMNFYLLGTEQVLYSTDPNMGIRPEGKALINFNLYLDALVGTKESDEFWHIVEAMYGIQHTGGGAQEL